MGNNIEIYEVNEFKNKILGDYSEGLIAVSDLDSLGNRSTVYFIDKNGTTKLETPYYDANTKFTDGLAPVANTNKGLIRYGFIDKKGNVVIDFKYDHARSFSDGLAAVRHDRKYSFIKEYGNRITPFIFDEVRDFSDGLAAVRCGDKWSYIDEKGNELFEYKFDDAKDSNLGLIPVKKGSKYGFIDKKGNKIIEFVYEDAESFSKEINLAPVKRDGKWGFINEKGEIVINFIYNGARSFSNGYAAVCEDSKCGYINRKGQKVIDFIYDGTGDFNDEIALVCTSDVISIGLNDNNTYKFINKDGIAISRFLTASELEKNKPCEVINNYKKEKILNIK